MNDKPHYKAHRQRLFEKFDNNPDMIFDYELIELLLCYSNMRKDMKPVAKEILKKHDSLISMLSSDLSDVKGVGPSTSRLIKAIRELYSRLQMAELKSGIAYSNPEQVFQFLQYGIGYSSVENVAVLLLNSKHHLIEYKIISEGVVDAAVLLPRQVADIAIKYNAANVILAHNHPSNDPTPSVSDRKMTAAVVEALDTLGIEVLDHVIICKTSYKSMKAMNLV